MSANFEPIRRQNAGMKLESRDSSRKRSQKERTLERKRDRKRKEISR
jgi:hypothetical protein